MNIYKVSTINDLNKFLKPGDNFKVLRSNNDIRNHSIVLYEEQTDSYIVTDTPTYEFMGDLYSIIICTEENKFYKSYYHIDIKDICAIVSEFRSKFPNTTFNLNIGLSLDTPINTENYNYYGKTYRDSDYIYKFPNSDIYMVANDCEPSIIYIMNGETDNDN